MNRPSAGRTGVIVLVLWALVTVGSLAVGLWLGLAVGAPERAPVVVRVPAPSLPGRTFRL